MPVGDALTVEDFANRIREKAPGDYDGVDDYDLTRRVLQKFPDYKSTVNFGPRERAYAAAARAGLPRDLADDFLNVTGGIESGNRHRNSIGVVIESPPDPKTGEKAVGFSQIKPSTIKPYGLDPYDEDQNIEGGLRYFSEGGDDPVARRIHYFGGPGALNRYKKTGRIPKGQDVTGTSFEKYVKATMPKASPTGDIYGVQNRDASSLENATTPTAAPVETDKSASINLDTSARRPRSVEDDPTKEPVGYMAEIRKQSPEFEAKFYDFLHRNTPPGSKAKTVGQAANDQSMAWSFLKIADFAKRNKDADANTINKGLSQIGVEFLRNPQTAGSQLPTALHDAMLAAHYTPDEWNIIPEKLRQQIRQYRTQIAVQRGREKSVKQLQQDVQTLGPTVEDWLPDLDWHLRMSPEEFQSLTKAQQRKTVSLVAQRVREDQLRRQAGQTITAPSVEEEIALRQSIGLPRRPVTPLKIGQVDTGGALLGRNKPYQAKFELPDAELYNEVRQQVLAENKARREAPMSQAQSSLALADADLGIEQQVEERVKEIKRGQEERSRLLANFTPAEKQNVADLSQQLAQHGTGVKRGIDIGIQGVTSGFIYKLAGAADAALAGGPNAWMADWLRKQALTGELSVEAVRKLPSNRRQDVAEFISSLAASLPEAVAATTVAGPVAGFAALGGLEAQGRGQGAGAVVKEAAKGALIGKVFDWSDLIATTSAPASVKETIKQIAKKSATVGAGTGLVELASGTPPKEAAKAAITNALLPAVMEPLHAGRVKEAENAIPERGAEASDVGEASRDSGEVGARVPGTGTGQPPVSQGRLPRNEGVDRAAIVEPAQTAPAKEAEALPRPDEIAVSARVLIEEAKERMALRARGYDEEQIAKMSSEKRRELLSRPYRQGEAVGVTSPAAPVKKEQVAAGSEAAQQPVSEGAAPTPERRSVERDPLAEMMSEDRRQQVRDMIANAPTPEDAQEMRRLFAASKAEVKPKVSRETSPTGDTAKTKKLRQGKPDIRTGLTPSQSEYVAKELEDNVARLINNRGEGQIKIDVPGDGTFTVKSPEQASRLHQRVSGEPLEGFEKHKLPSVQGGTKRRIPPTPDLQPQERFDRLVERFGSEEKALDAMKKTLEQHKQEFPEDTKGQYEQEGIIAGLENRISERAQQGLRRAANEAQAKLDALGPEPHKPSNEARYFGKRGREGAQPEDVARYDTEVKTYNTWRRKYNVLKKAQVEASNAAFHEEQRAKGPGAATVGDVPLESTMKQLTEAMKDIRPGNAEAKTRAALNVADTVTEGQSAIVRGLARLKAVADSVRNYPAYTDYKKSLGEFLYQSQKSDHETRMFVKEIEKRIPDSIRREALTNYIQADGDIDLLKKRALASTGRLKKGYEAAQNLTPEEKLAATHISSYFESRWQEGQKEGIIGDAVDNYVNQVWKRENPVTKALRADVQRGILDPTFKFSKKRVFQSYFEGEQAGFTPLSKDVGHLLSIYNQSFDRAIRSRQFIRSLHDGVASDGRPLAEVSGNGAVVPKGSPDVEAYLIHPKIKPPNTYDYRAIDHPAMRGWKSVAATEDGQPIILQGDMIVHPEAYAHLKNVLGKSVFGQYAVLRGIKRVQSTIKQTMLSLSGFHQVQEATHALGHRVNVTEKVGIPGLADLKRLDFDDPLQADLVRGGLQVASFDALQEFSEGITGGNLVNKIPIVGSKIFEPYQEWLFRDYIPRLKMTMATHAFERNVKRYPKLSREQVAELTASQANAAFGELNYRYMGRNPTFQDMLRTFLLAPDFLEARARFVGQSVKPFGREQLVALGVLAATQYITARILNKFTDDDPHWEMENAFRVVHKGHWYGMRTVPADLLHLFQDPRHFAYYRLSPLMNTTITALTGRDDRGQKTDAAEQIKNFLTAPIPIILRRHTDDAWWEGFVNSMGVQEGKFRTKAEQMMSKYYQDNLPLGEEDPTEQGYHSLKRQLTEKARGGEDVGEEVKSLVEQGKLKPADLKDISANAKLSRLQMQFKGLPAKVAIDVYKEMKPAEQEQVKDILKQKGYSIQNLRAGEQADVKKKMSEAGVEPPIPDSPASKEMTRLGVKVNAPDLVSKGRRGFGVLSQKDADEETKAIVRRVDMMVDSEDYKALSDDKKTERLKMAIRRVRSAYSHRRHYQKTEPSLYNVQPQP